MLRLTRPYKKALIGFVIMVVTSAAVGCRPTLLFKALLDDAVPKGDKALVAILAFGAVALAVTSATLSLLQRFFSARIGEGLIYDMRVTLFDHVQRLPISFFTRTQTGALMSAAQQRRHRCPASGHEHPGHGRLERDHPRRHAHGDARPRVAADDPQVLDFEPLITDRPGSVPIERPRGRVEFEHVWFRHPSPAVSSIASLEEGSAPMDEESSAWILRDVSFSVEPGELVALVGPSGAGKTTTALLVPRIHEVSQGSITLDGMDVRDITLESLRNAVGMVMQDPHLFHESIAENLRYAKPDATDVELVAACRAADPRRDRWFPRWV